jgi:hypothetical protein
VTEVKAKNGINRGMSIFLFFLAVVLVVLIAGMIAQNGSFGTSSWSNPGVGRTVNGYSGAPVGAPIYRSSN